jgi:hypothetical protein
LIAAIKLILLPPENAFAVTATANAAINLMAKGVIASGRISHTQGGCAAVYFMAARRQDFSKYIVNGRPRRCAA